MCRAGFSPSEIDCKIKEEDLLHCYSAPTFYKGFSLFQPLHKPPCGSVEHLPAFPHGLSTSYRKVVKSQLLCPNSLLGSSQAAETGGRQPNLHLLALKEMTSCPWLAEVFVERRICSVAWKILKHSLESQLSPFSPCLHCLLIKKLEASFETSIPVPAALLKPRSRRREGGWTLSHANWAQEDCLPRAIPDEK